MATVRKAKALRREQTPAEQALWRLLRSKQLDGLKFRRQHPIGPYIADFACYSAKLVVELDGGQHADNVEHDEKRTEALTRDGWRVLRFWNPDVLRDPQSIVETILAAADPSRT